jgi:hypothetical protein
MPIKKWAYENEEKVCCSLCPACPSKSRHIKMKRKYAAYFALHAHQKVGI